MLRREKKSWHVNMSRKGPLAPALADLTFLSPFLASRVYITQFCLTSPASPEYCFMAGLHVPSLHPFMLGACASWGAGFSEVAQSLHLLPLALWSRRSCLAHGYCSVPRGCGVLSASEICLAFLLPLATPPHQLSFAPHPVWSRLN